MGNFATATYFTTNAAKFRGSIVTNKQRKAMLLYALALVSDSQNGTTYATNLPAFRAVADNLLKGAEDSDDFSLSAQIAMTLGAYGSNPSLATLLTASNQAVEWDEAAIDRAILIQRGMINAI